MPEEEAFCVFVKLMQDYRLRELFKPTMAELGLCMYQFEFMIQVKSFSPATINYSLVEVEWSLRVTNLIDRFHLSGTTPRAAHALSGSELSHLHVCLLLVSHYFPHILSTAHCHKDIWHLHVRGWLKEFLQTQMNRWLIINFLYTHIVCKLINVLLRLKILNSKIS